jgi:hypothetical protein
VLAPERIRHGDDARLSRGERGLACHEEQVEVLVGVVVGARQVEAAAHPRDRLARLGVHVAGVDVRGQPFERAQHPRDPRVACLEDLERIIEVGGPRIERIAARAGTVLGTHGGSWPEAAPLPRPRRRALSGRRASIDPGEPGPYNY